jgi:hypothetical protein
VLSYFTWFRKSFPSVKITHTLHLHQACYMSCPFYVSCLVDPSNIRWRMQNVKVLICSFCCFAHCSSLSLSLSLRWAPFPKRRVTWRPLLFYSLLATVQCFTTLRSNSWY